MKLSLLFVCLLYTLPAISQTPTWEEKVSPGLLSKMSGDEEVEFLIIMHDQADVSDAGSFELKEEKGSFVFNTLRQFAEQSQKPILDLLDAQNVSYQSLFIVNAIHAKGNASMIQTIARRQDVRIVIDDTPVKYSTPEQWQPSYTHSRNAVEWGIAMINADDVWELGFRGEGVVVGGEDTGYEWDHPALINQYRGYDKNVDTVNHNYNWHDAIHALDPHNPDSTLNPCGLDSKVPCDDRGHGTHTMGTMIGLDSANQIGVAPEAQWCGCRNMERGWGTPFTYIECFQWFLGPTDLNNENPDPSKAPHVINNSWSCPVVEGCDSSNWEVMNLVVNNLRVAGIVVVVSAGNSGSSCSSITTPAAIFEGSFSVGATAMNDTIAGFSSRGPVAVDSSFRLKPNVSAPGVFVRSASLNGGYVHSSGTSMAGPHVAGVVALMISANPQLAGKVDLIEDIIEQTAVPKTTDQNCDAIPGWQVPNYTYGYGRIDALAAVQAAALIEVGTKDINTSSRIIVFPNPATNQISISIAEASSFSIDIFDTDGKIHISKNLDDHHNGLLDITSLIPGIYFYRIILDDEIHVGKFVKQ